VKWFKRVQHLECEARQQQAMEELAIQIARSSRHLAQAEALAGELAQVRAALNTVSVYEGLVDVSPVAMMVSELARDHEELEARIDAALHHLSGLPTDDGALAEVRTEVARLLQGGTRVPDSPADLG
jgi:hypothetical protein